MFRIILLLLGLSITSTYAQSKVHEEAAPLAPEEDLSKLIPILFYTPDTSFGAGGFLIRNLDQKADGDPSQLIAFLTVTSKKQIISVIEPKIYWDHGLWEWANKLGSQDFPSTFYGRESYEFKKNSGEDYKEVKTNFETRLKNIYFGRHFWEIQYTNTQQRYTIDIDSPLLKTEFEKWGYSSQQQSLQLGLGYDSRNSKIRSTEGHLLNLFYKQTALDSEKLKQNFGLFGFDYKLYLSIDADHSLAIQLASSQQEHKDLPFYALAGLGGNQILRGYYGNQFRDYALGFSQIEWRTLWKESWGYRCFLGYGMHATKISQLELSQTKFAGGLGIDYFLDQKTKNNLRFDIGYSPGQVGIYFLYGNAF